MRLTLVIAPLSIIDFISIVPFYIELIAKRDTVCLFDDTDLLYILIIMSDIRI